MSFLGNLLNRIRGKEKARSSLTKEKIGALEVYTPIDSTKAIDNGFQGNAAVYSIVMKDAEKFGSIPRYVMDADASEEKAVPNPKSSKEELIKLLNRPNEYQSQDAFFMAVRAYFKICGEAFIWLNRGDVATRIDEYGQEVERASEEYEKMPILEMYVLPSNYITVVPDEDNLWGVKNYILECGTRIPLKECDVIHWKTPNLKFDAVSRTHLRGLSPLTPGFRTLEQNNSATNSAVRMYQNDGAKGILFNEQVELSPQQESDVREVVKEKVNNNDVKGQVAAFQGKWGYINLGGTSVDLQLLDGKKLSMMELCFLFGVPYTMFDPNTAFANSEWQQKNWISNTIIPHSKQLDGELNRSLLKAFGLEGVCFIASDFSELPELQQDLGKMASALGQADWLTMNEKREAMNFEKMEGNEMMDKIIVKGGTPIDDLKDDGSEDILNELRKRGLAGEQGGD